MGTDDGDVEARKRKRGPPEAPKSGGSTGELQTLPSALETSNGAGLGLGALQKSLGRTNMPPILFPDLVSYQDPILAHVCEFLMHKLIGASNLEIEAKFGLLIDKETNTRIHLPIVTESILASEASSKDYRFESNMSPEIHQYLNGVLNKRVEDSSSLHFAGIPLRYKRSLQLDEFYTTGNKSTGFDKIRASYHYEEPTGAGSAAIDSGKRDLIQVIRKERLADLALHFPRSSFDVRLSINREVKLDSKASFATNEAPAYVRKKRRLSYLFGRYFQFDLTQVEQFHGAPRSTHDGPGHWPALKEGPKTHELELEWLDPAAFIHERNKMLKGHSPPAAFEDIAKILLSNIRQICSLVRK